MRTVPEPCAIPRIPLVGYVTDQVRDCGCDLCDAHAYALSRTETARLMGYRWAWDECQATADALIDALREGTHQHTPIGQGTTR